MFLSNITITLKLISKNIFNSLNFNFHKYLYICNFRNTNMLKKRAQGLSITTIIVAVIGLIILVVVILMITGKLGAFSSGVESSSSCENICKAIGKVGYLQFTSDSCKGNDDYTIMPGKFSDIDPRSDPETEKSFPYICCCLPR